MYRKNQYRQFSLTDFNQPIGLKMNPENRWVKKAEMIPWDAIEEKYAALFPSNTGMPAKPLRMALGSLLIQKQLGFSDQELVEEITENPYLQFFVGLPGYQSTPPFVPSLLVEFRKRLSAELIDEINEMIIDYNSPDDPTPPGGGDSDDKTQDASSEGNQGTLILDATCAPQNISYPQDTNLLNEVRENFEDMIDYLCAMNNLHTPRMYRENARKDYLNFAKSKKRTKKRIRLAIKQQLQYIRRDRKYLDTLLSQGYKLTARQVKRLQVLDLVYEQQKYMYENKTHSVPDRIVSISQPYIRPIVRGKAKAPVEFGAKLDLSLDEKGMARIERMSFDAYNESEVLQEAVEKYKARTGRYPERVLVDQIYRNRDNIAFCKIRGIRISGPALGRPKKDAKVDKTLEYKDNTDRIAVERRFALAKHSYGLGLLTTKLDETTRSSIALSVLAMNVDRLLATSLCLILILIFSSNKQRNFTLKFINSKSYEKLATC
ncbi:MAG: IS5 family transposase [Bacteroidaceae bacterium]|nr:IS5 family transposase [Bacteroidaceae bacterium]